MYFMRENRRKLLLTAWLLFLAVAIHGATATNAVRTVAELRAQIESHLAQPKFAAAVWGVKIVSLDSGKIIFEQHADRLMNPASNCKLYIGALGLDKFGGDYRFATPVFATGKISPDGVLTGNLLIVGQGDPSWNERRLGTNFWTAFEPFASLLAKSGVRRIQGDLVADATLFRGPPTGSSWTIDDLNVADAAEISALTLDDNVAQLRVEPGASVGTACRCGILQPGTGLAISNQAVTAASNVPAHLQVFRRLDGAAVYVLGEAPAGGTNRLFQVAVPRPANWFATALKLALERHGIRVSGQAVGITWPDSGAGSNPAGLAGAIKLGTVWSPPLREVVSNFMKPSQNVEADLLLAHVGEMTRGSNAPPWQTSEQAGLAALDRFLAAAGVPPGDVQFDEGSGLSRNNLATANATVALLQFMARHRESADFIAALPVGGIDDALRNRFANPPAAGNVRAKTGTLRWAQALSGYVTTAAGERLAFSIMLNRFVAAPGHGGSEVIDPVVLLLANFAGRSGE
jgi:D-alanyl-D-alanine carboxypeptidase/D-alanyl-D-alanine-endopeptidase (penicillin-binding protein 4)